MNITRNFAPICLVFLLFGCNTDFLLNKVTINGFNLKESENELVLTFDVNYYSDSTISNYNVETMEKGGDGLNGEIIYFGFSNKDTVVFDKCEHDQFETLLLNINTKNRAYVGENFDREYLLCRPSNYKHHESRIMLILQDSTSGEIDTLYNSDF